DAIGTLGETIGDSPGVPLWEAAKGVVSMQAAGVLEEMLESDGHAVRPAGVEATPAATLGDPALVTQAAPSPEPGHGCAPSGRLTWRPSLKAPGQCSSLMVCAHAAAARW